MSSRITFAYSLPILSSLFLSLFLFYIFHLTSDLIEQFPSIDCSSPSQTDKSISLRMGERTSFLPSSFYFFFFEVEREREREREGEREGGREREKEDLDFLEQATFTRSLIYALCRLFIRTVASPGEIIEKDGRRRGRKERGKSERIESGRTNERVRRGTVARPTLRRSNFDPCRARFPFCLCTQVWHRSRIGFVPSARDGASMTRDTRTKRKRVVAPIRRCPTPPIFPTELSQLRFRSFFTSVAPPIFLIPDSELL